MNTVYDCLLIRFGEMSLKGKNRRDFIKRLTDNIKTAFKAYPSLVYCPKHDRLFIELNNTEPDRLIALLSTVFGISSFSLALKTETSLEAISQAALTLASGSTAKTFKIDAHRSDKRFTSNSDTINRAAAAVVLKNTNLKVDVHNPELMILVEVREDGTYVTDNKYPGALGFPVGSASRALLMLSGGIDSPVAGYLSMKRGLSLHYLHFESSPYTSVQALNKVRDLAKKLCFYQGRAKLHIIPFTKMQMAINREVPESYSITIMRRMMMRIAERVAEENRCLAIVNGESLGQVASQTLESMRVIGEVTKLPILRPVLTYDKLEIITLAKKIDTYDISCLPFEDCCTIFTPKNPTTQPSLAKAWKYEEKFNYNELIEECVKNKTTEVLSFTEE